MTRAMFLLMMACLAVCGCKNDPPSIETVATTATAVGKAAGYATQFISDKQLVSTIVTVVEKVSAVVPGTNDTCVSVWTPVVEAELKKIIDAGKLTDSQASLATTAILLAAEGVDYYCKYKLDPTQKTYSELLTVAVKNICSGFVSVVEKKSVTTAPFNQNADDYDKEAYEYLSAKAAKK